MGLKNKSTKQRVYFKAIRIKYFWLVLIALVFAASVFTYNYNLPAFSSSLQPTDIKALSVAMVGKTVVIDPGHGGFDPGAIGISGIKEKDVNLAIAKRVVNYLKQVGATVITTRSEDNALAETKKADMQGRVKVAQDNMADLFISIQANSIPQHQYRGAQVFYHSASDQGKLLAESIQKSMVENLQNTHRVAMPIKDVFVVQSLEIPSIVVEVGFLSNAQEEILLADPKYQNLVAYSIFSGIVEYYANASDKAPVKTSSETTWSKIQNFFQRLSAERVLD